MLEKEITNQIMKYLKTVPLCFCWKQHGGAMGTAGLPDIIVCYRRQFVAFEVKTETGKPTKLQESTIRKIQAAKGEAFIVRSVGEVREIIQILDTLEVPYDEKRPVPAILAQPRD
ncbi:MAG: VRR-NUC domain-containing protein [Oscillospiraceae bacterium]|nr:VRR-NUC domain-containing protein [Oscillospiraceae bacterium]